MDTDLCRYQLYLFIPNLIIVLNRINKKADKLASLTTSFQNTQS